MNPRPISISIEPCPSELEASAAAFLRALLYDEFGFTPDPLLDKDFGGLIAHYRRGRGELWIATGDGRIIATTALLDLALVPASSSSADPSARAGGDAELKRMFVAPELRGLGVGKQLLTAAIEHARARGFDRVVLDSTRDMSAAIHLYSAAGFREIADYNGNRRADIFMALRL